VDPRRIADLLAPFLQSPPGPPAALTGAQLEQVSAYLDLLLRWNARISLTAVRDPESISTRYFCRHDKNIFVSDHVSGHEFTRAATRPYDSGFSP